MSRIGVWKLVLISCLLLSCFVSPTISAKGEFYEGDDEFEGEEVIETQRAPVHEKDIKKVNRPEKKEGRDDEYDDEEFILEKNARASKKQWIPENLDIDKEAVNSGEEISLEKNYYLEIFYVSFIVLYGVCYLWGKRQNEKIATEWGITFNELFTKEFGQVGFDSMLIKESNNKFVLIATGRVNCVGLQATIELKKRHDLAFLIWNLFRNNSKDLLTIDIALEENIPFLFALVPSKEEKRYKKEVDDIKLLGHSSPKLIEELSVPKKFSILTDSNSLASQILSSAVVKTLQEHEKGVELIHITDQNATDKYKSTLKFQFNIPPRGEIKNLKTLIQMSLYFIDVVAELKLSPQTLKQQKELRTKAEIIKKKVTAEEREEAKQRLIEEKRKKEKENLTPEQLEKLQIKRQKKLSKKKAKSKYQVIARV